MICPNCNRHNDDDARFCRHCGAKVQRRTCENGHAIPDGLEQCPWCPASRRGAGSPPAPAAPPAADPVAPAAVPPSPQAAPEADLHPSGGCGCGVLPWLLGAAFVCLGLATLAGVALLLHVSSTTDDVVQGTAGATPPSTAQADLGDAGQAPLPLASPVSLASASAGEIERPAAFPYTSARSTCTEHAMMTDVVKQVGIGIDQQMRTVETVSTQEEQEIGAEYVRQLPQVLGGRLQGSGPLPGYLASVARPLLAHVLRKDVAFHFYVLEDTDVENAMALPGGHVVVTRPLFDSWATNEARLATVLAHEMAHVDNRHPIAVVQYARLLGLPDDDEVAQGLIWLAQMPYSSALEEEADRDGAGFAHRAGYSVFQSVALWRDQERRDGVVAPTEGAPADDPLGVLLSVATGELESLVSSHPNAGRRACLLEQTAYDLFRDEPRDAVYVGTTNLRRQTPMADRVF